MGWKFWQKKAPVPTATARMDWPTDSYGAVKLLAALFVAPDVPPFNEWQSPDAQLEAGTEGVAEWGAKGLVLALWFWQFAQTHGDVAAQMARDAFLDYLSSGASPDVAAQVDGLLNLVNDGRRSFEEMPEDKKVVSVGEQQIEITVHWGLAIFLLVRMSDSPYYGKESAGDADLPVAACLQHAAQQSQRMWQPMLAAIGPFNPATYPTWRWSSHLGAYERHLQRRHKNVLFPAERRQVSAMDVYYARLRDQQALMDVRRRLGAIHEAMQEELPVAWHKHLNGIRERLDEAHDDLTAAGGDEHLDEAWRSMRAHIMKVWRLCLGEDADGLAAFDRAEATFAEEQSRRTAWGMQVSGKSSSIPSEEAVPALLTEPIEDIEKVAASKLEVLNSIRPAALRCVMEALTEGQVPQHREKLLVLGVPI
jgi:hypothetical protein